MMERQQTAEQMDRGVQVHQNRVKPLMRGERDMQRYFQLTRILRAHAPLDEARASRAVALRSVILGRLETGEGPASRSALQVLASEAASWDARTLLAMGLGAPAEKGLRSET